jgi:hypothetical protein
MKPSRKPKHHLTYLFHFGSQQVPVLALSRSTANLAHEFIQLLLVKDAFALALELVCGRLRQRGLVHDAAAVGGAAGANPSNVRDGSRQLGSFLRKNFGDRHFCSLQILWRELSLLWRVRVGMSLHAEP